MLKSLELHGFKSFADRTRFDFSPGITGVVGPNGSGKSNVVDGIKWILGDQSAKSLRGKEMTDVIFNGAGGRKASALAEATLTFDNSSGFLPIESREVQIGRRLWRSGDSEYLINRTPARLKDIRDLFMGTGAGSAAYCIIEQGRVDQILQANAVSRRQIFEEAAGISRYKARKVDALRKLERVEQNLLRLKDIVSEVETRLVSLRAQAARASSWRECSEELRELWLGLAADDWRHWSRDLEQIAQARQECEGQLQQCKARQQELESRITLLDTEIAVVDDRLRGVERQLASTRELIASHRSTTGHQTARLHELDGDLLRLGRQRTLLTARAREGLSELDAGDQELERVEQQCSEMRGALAERQAEIEQLERATAAERDTVDQRRREMMERMRAAVAAEAGVTALHSRRDAFERERQTARQRCDGVDAQLAACSEELFHRRHLLEAADVELASARAQLDQARAQGRSLSAARDELLQTLAEQRRQRTGLEARIAVLEEWENRQEGLGVGIREILRRSGEHDHPPWSRIHGCAADLLHVDLEHAALVEVALGGRAQLVVISEFDALLDYVMSPDCRIAGRVGFVERADAAPVALGRDADLSKHPGVIARADRLIRADLPGLAERLLGDTWIVETLAVAFDLVAGPGRGARFVTLQGELLDSDGTLTVGTLRSETAVVSRASELRRLKNDLPHLDSRIQDSEGRIVELEASRSASDEQTRLAEQAVETATEAWKQRRSDLEQQQRELERLQREKADAESELSRIDADETRLNDAIAEALAGLDEAQSELQAVQSDVADAEAHIAEGERRLNQEQQRITAERIELSRSEERLAALRAARERMEYERRQRLLQAEEAQRRYESTRVKRREITLSILNTSAVLAELALEDEVFLAQAEKLIENRTSLKGERADLLREETALRHRRRELSDRQHQEEIRERDLRHQLDVLAQRIEEEYQLRLSEVVASGASAVRRYRENPEISDQRSERQDVDADPERTDNGQRTTDNGSASHQSPVTPDETNLYREIRGELEERVNRLRRKLKAMGSVNADSLGDLDDLERRYAQQHAQLQDLVEAKSALEDIVRRINAESKRLFLETFEAVRGHFQHLFRKAFGGGDGDLVLEDPDDVLECGIEIVARPPGKELKSLSLMSGGEKALTAFALLLALFKTRPSPYCLLDEVDAPLDEANVGRLGALLEEFKGSTQFIVITHKKPTMTIADVLYGVTMEEAGVSKRMSVRFEDVSENGEFSTRAAAA